MVIATAHGFKEDFMILAALWGLSSVTSYSYPWQIPNTHIQDFSVTLYGATIGIFKTESAVSPDDKPNSCHYTIWHVQDPHSLHKMQLKSFNVSLTKSSVGCISTMLTLMMVWWQAALLRNTFNLCKVLEHFKQYGVIIRPSKFVHGVTSLHNS